MTWSGLVDARRTATPAHKDTGDVTGRMEMSTDEMRPSPVRDGMLPSTQCSSLAQVLPHWPEAAGAGRMHDERASVTHPDFDEAAWIERLAAALEQVAAEGRPSYYPPPTELGGYGSPEERQSALRRAYRALAARAKHDPTASIQFKASRPAGRLTDPVDAIDNPEGASVDRAGYCEGSGKRRRGCIQDSQRGFSLNLEGPCSIVSQNFRSKEGGEEAARRLHRYLAAGANGTVPAYEITVIHGLVVKTLFNLDAGAYLAPYGDARAEFGLPDEPEPLSQTSFPDAAVLVRGLEYGPGVAPPGDYRRPTRCAGRLPLPCWTTASTLSNGLSTASCSSTCSQSPHGFRCFPARFTSA